MSRGVIVGEAGRRDWSALPMTTAERGVTAVVSRALNVMRGVGCGDAGVTLTLA